MFIKRLLINDFRNLQYIDITPSQGFNFICGPNGSGKTSLIEAIHYLALARSFRTNSYQYLIRQGLSCFNLYAEVQEDNRILPTTIGLTRGRGRDAVIKLNADVISRMLDLIDHICVQLIHPQGVELITKEAEGRRGFVDWGVYYTDPEFKSLWWQYRKILRQRNALLRQQNMQGRNQQRSAYAALSALAGAGAVNANAMMQGERSAVGDFGGMGGENGGDSGVGFSGAGVNSGGVSGVDVSDSGVSNGGYDNGGSYGTGDGYGKGSGDGDVGGGFAGNAAAGFARSTASGFTGGMAAGFSQGWGLGQNVGPEVAATASWQRIEQMPFWDDALATLAQQITEKRLRYLHDLQEILQDILHDFLPNFKLKFDLNFGWDKSQDLRALLAQNLEKDRVLGYTLYGCHRADLKIKNGNLAAGATLSRGQLKMLVYAMRLAQGILLKQQTGRACIYLIDDLNSELDDHSQRILLQTLLSCQHQVFISNIHALQHDSFPAKDRSDYQVFYLHEGQIGTDQGTAFQGTDLQTDVTSSVDAGFSPDSGAL